LQTASVLLSQSVRQLAFGQGIVLWHEGRGGIFVCNSTMLLLLPSLAKGTAAGELAAILCEAYGIEEQQALDDCAALLFQLRKEGLLEGSGHGRTHESIPQAMTAHELSDPACPAGGFTTRINGKTIRVSASKAIAEFLRPLFPDTQPGNGAADTEISCRPDGCGAAITVDGLLRAQPTNPDETAGAIIEQVIRAVNPQAEWLAFVHAGAVLRNGTAIVLPAPAGSGKSTLIGYLASHGFDYLADDLVPLIAPRGEVAAWPLAINLKAGSRGLYPAPASFEAVTLQDRFRTDQLLVPPSGVWETPPAPTRAIVFPRYEQNARTSFAPVPPIEGLARLFKDRVFLGYPLKETTVASFLRWAGETPFCSLEYSELAEAAECLVTLTG
jgi:hypothetical protein